MTVRLRKLQGKVAIKLGYLSPDQVRRLFMLMRDRPAKTLLADEAVDQGFLDEEQGRRVRELAGRALARREAAGATDASSASEEELEEAGAERIGEFAKNAIAGYELKEVVGSGSMATVYRAVRLSLDQEVALKVLAPELGDSPTDRARFLREARAAARVTHPNVVSIYDTGESNGYPYIAMEFVAGQNLRDLAREAPLSEEAALEVGAGIAAALGAAHQAGLIHRDVKPENMIRTPEGRTKLCDLGLARTAAESEARPLLAGPITDHGRTMGTPYFFSPEQARGKTLDIRSDLYSLGVSLFYLATGRPPFKGATPPVVLKMHLVDPPPVPSSLSPSLSPAFDALIGKLLEKDPGRRHQTPAELGEAIAALLGGEKAPAGSAAKVSPRRAPAVVRPGPARRRPAPTAAGPGRAERRRPVATPPRPRDAVGALAQWVAICACLFLVLLWVRSQLGEIEPPSTSTDRGASASVDGS